MSERKRMHGSRFTFGPQPGGFGAEFYLETDGAVSGQVTLTIEKEGPPGHAHGGSLATLLDEAMGMAVWSQGLRVLAANLNVNYKRPVPLNQPITVRGWVERRKVFTAAAITCPTAQSPPRPPACLSTRRPTSPPARKPISSARRTEARRLRLQHAVGVGCVIAGRAVYRLDLRAILLRQLALVIHTLHQLQ